MAGGRKSKAKQNTTKRRRKSSTSNSVSEDPTKSAIEVDSPVPEKKLLLDDTLRCKKGSANQVNENSQLGVNLQRESPKDVPPFSRRESIASAAGVADSQQDSPRKETRSSRKIELDKSFSRPRKQPAKPKPKVKATCSNIPYDGSGNEKQEELSKAACNAQRETSLKDNKLGEVKSSDKDVFSSVQETALLSEQKNGMAEPQYIEEVITELLNEILQSVEGISRSEGKEEKGFQKKEVTFVKEAQMERKAPVKRNVKLKKETKTLKIVKPENKIVKNITEEEGEEEEEEEEPLEKESVDKESGSKFSSQNSDIPGVKLFPKSANNEVSFKGMDCVATFNSDGADLVTDSHSIRKVKEWLQLPQKNQGTEEQGYDSATASSINMTTNVAELTFNGENKQELSLSQNHKQEKFSYTTATADSKNMNSDASLQLSTDKLAMTKAGQSFDRMLVSEEVQRKFSVDDLKTVGDIVNDLCKAVVNNESQRDLKPFAASVCQSGENATVDYQTNGQLRETLQVVQKVSQREELSNVFHGNQDVKRSAFCNEQVFAGKSFSSPKECMHVVSSKETCHTVEILSPYIDTCNGMPDISCSRETQDHALEEVEENVLDAATAVSKETDKEKETQPQYINIVNSFCTLHDDESLINELTTKSIANFSLHTATCCSLDENSHSTCLPDNKPSVKEIENGDSTCKLQENDSASLDDIPLSQRPNNSKMQNYQDTKLKRATSPDQHLTEAKSTNQETEVVNTTKPELDEKAVKEPKRTTITAADPMITDTFPAVKASFEDQYFHGTVAAKPHTVNNAFNYDDCSQTQSKDISCNVSDSSVGVLGPNSLKKIDPDYARDQLRADGVQKEQKDIIGAVDSANSNGLSSTDPSVDVNCKKEAVSAGDVSEMKTCTRNENGMLSDTCAIKTNKADENGLVNIHFTEDGSEPFLDTCTDNVVILAGSSQNLTPKHGEFRMTFHTHEVLNKSEKAVDATCGVDTITPMKSSCGRVGDEKLDSTDNPTNEHCLVINAAVKSATAMAGSQCCDGTNLSKGGVSRDLDISVEELLKSEDFSDSQLIQTAATCMASDQTNQGKPLVKQTSAEPVDCHITTEGCEMIKGLIKELSALNQYVMQAKREVDVLKKQRQMRMKALKIKRT